MVNPGVGNYPSGRQMQFSAGNLGEIREISGKLGEFQNLGRGFIAPCRFGMRTADSGDCD